MERRRRPFQLGGDYITTSEELRGGEQDQDQEGDEARAVAGEEVGEEVGASEASSSGVWSDQGRTGGVVDRANVPTDFTAFMIGSTISVPAQAASAAAGSIGVRD